MALTVALFITVAACCLSAHARPYLSAQREGEMRHFVESSYGLSRNDYSLWFTVDPKTREDLMDVFRVEYAPWVDSDGKCRTLEWDGPWYMYLECVQWYGTAPLPAWWIKQQEEMEKMERVYGVFPCGNIQTTLKKEDA